MKTCAACASSRVVVGNAGGVEARFDREDHLLHSKFLVLDRRTVVLGSHNWSAGSYFKYDDVSLVLTSEPLDADLEARFESLWSASHAED